ncbi:hypothetical protein HDU76_009624 [Blyttiomyces sp. JEL0837]|nr:hypothetical protein HDU76_009624 [Blyttiomyces sp. JEL0837]
MQQQIAQAAAVLTNDVVFYKCEEYEKHWTYLINALADPEPIVRNIALRGIVTASKSILRTLADKKLKHQLVHALCDVVNSETNLTSRCLSTRALAATMVLISSDDFSEKIKLLAYKTLLNQFLRAFAANLSMDEEEYVHPDVMRERVTYLNAFAHTFRLTELHERNITTLVDRLFVSLLQPHSNVALQIAVVNALALHLPVTNKNRLRIEDKYRRVLINLTKWETAALKLGDDDDANEEQEEKEENSGEENSPEQRPEQHSRLKEFLQSRISLFWSTWYPKPYDEELLEWSVADETPLLKSTDGYCFRRCQWLTAKPHDAFQRPAGYAKEESEDRNNYEYCKRLRMTLLAEGNPDDINSRFFEVKQKPALRLFGIKSEEVAIVEQADSTPKPEIVVLSGFETIDASFLTFNLPSPQIVFNRFPFTKDAYLVNRSQTMDISFSLQLYPAKYFYAHPCAGVIRKGTSKLITIYFTPQPFSPRKNPEINGFIRVRSLCGIPFERISLKAYNMPALKVFPSEINFGFCPTSETRTASFVVQNLLPIECPCVVVMDSSENESAFMITPLQSALLPKEKRMFKIRFGPTEEEEYNMIFYVIALGGEVYKLNVRGKGGYALKFLDNKLDFGPTDIYYDQVVKRVFVQNRDEKNSYPLLAEVSSDEIVINDNKPVLIPPGEVVSIKVSFKSKISGSRQEYVTFFAPNSNAWKIDVIAYSGPAIRVPIMEEIIFPTALTSQPIPIQIPITNLSATVTQCQISLPPLSPFTMRLLDPETSNRKTLEKTSLVIEMKAFEGPDAIGGMLTIGPRLTAVVEINFLSTTWGTFRIPLTIQTIKPRKAIVGTYQLSAIAVNEVYLSREKPIEAIQRFLTNPAAETPTGLLIRRSSEGKHVDPLQKGSDVFDLEPPTLMCFGASLADRYNDIYEFVTLTNVSAVTQPYRIVVSYPFYTDLPSTGELDSLTSIEIPIRLRADSYQIASAKDTLDFLTLGQVSVFDSHSRLGMVTSTLFGTIGHLMDVEVRAETDGITFPSMRVMEKYTKKIYVHNKAPFEVVWEGRMSSVGQRGAGLQSDGNPMIVPSAVGEWCPFGLNSTRFSLKPYEFGTIDVNFQATSSGEYHAKLFMNYVDPVTHVVNHEHQRGRTKRDLRSLQFECLVGTQDVELETEALNFGNVTIGSNVVGLCSLVNNQPLDTKMSLLCEAPFSTKLWQVALKSNNADIRVKFSSFLKKSFSTILFIAAGQQTKSLSIFGFAGFTSLCSNLAIPLTIKNDPQAEPPPLALANCIDFGFVNIVNPKFKVLKLTNMGTFDIIIRNIALSDNGHLRWRFLDDYEFDNSATASFSEDDNVYWERVETDFDEVDFKGREDRVRVAEPTQGVVSTETTKAVANSSKKRRQRSVSHATVATNFGNMHKNLPARLHPYQTISIALTFGGFDKGVYHSTIRIDTEREHGESEIYQMWAQGNIQPPLQLWDKKLEFGVRAVHSRHRGEIKFTNSGTTSLSWVLHYKKTLYQSVARFDPQPLPADIKSLSEPFVIFPLSGKLESGCTQSLDVIFCASLPQYKVTSLFVLSTEDFADAALTIHGLGASSRLVADQSSLDFGVLRVGSSRVIKMKVRNKGILPARYFVECGSNQVSADPEQGLLEGDGSIELTIKYSPKGIGALSSFLRITPQSAESYRLSPLDIAVKGVSAYPELVVITKVIDFGTALYGSPNRGQILVENRGAADAHVIFSCHHPAIQLEGGNNGEVVIPPLSQKTLVLIYTPSVVEYLDVKAFLRSSDTRGDYFMLHLKGSVGVPKLTIMPTNILQSLNFGVCAVNSPHKKSFAMKNDGNINLTFELVLELVVANTEEYGITKAVIPRRSIVTIEPTNGVLVVGESRIVTLHFNPEMLASYEYRLLLKYDFRLVTATVKGIGGRAILSIDSPLRLVDFGICRMHRIFRKAMSISNSGNLGVNFYVRPDKAPKDWNEQPPEIEPNSSIEADEISERPAQPIEEESPWILDLKSLGFRILNANGFCPPHSQTDIEIEFKPTTESNVTTRLKIYFGQEFEEIEVRGRAAVPSLAIYTPSNECITNGDKVSTLDLGVHPVYSEYIHVLKLSNESLFGIDFLIQPIGIREFDIYPLRGYIQPDSSIPLKIFFRPNSENKFQMTLKVLWEKEPLRVNVFGSGGIGKLEVAYLDDRDLLMKGLDFGMVPFNTSSEKRFFVYNIGLVPINIRADVDNEDFMITQIGEPFVSTKGFTRTPNKKSAWNWFSNMKISLSSGTGAEIGAKFSSRSPTVSTGNILIRSECRDISISMRGKGGTISITHKGDLGFGDIASNYTYTRKLTIVNAGSIAANLSMEWSNVGHANEPMSSFIKLSENYSSLDPRSGWTRNAVLREKGSSDAKLTARDYWRMIGKIVRKSEGGDNTEQAGQNLSKVWLNRARDGQNQHSVTAGSDSSTSIDGLVGATAEARSRLSSSQGSYSILHGKKTANAHFSNLFKRRQMFYHLISSSQLTSQSNTTSRPHLRVEPSNCILPSFGEVTLTVDLNLSTEDTFLATLLVKPQVPNTPTYEIALSATPKAVSILCDDTRMLNFYRQPMGESESLSRNFTNVGHKDISFKITNTNPGLIVVPGRGILKVGQTLNVQFIFRPMEEAMQTADVIFEPDCSQPIRLKMNGGGGFAKASLAKYRRFDFGHCMIGKDTVSLLPITNEGNAMLHLTRFEIIETDTFFRGVGWPISRVSLFPGQTFNLPLVFNPHEESPPPGKLVIGTNSEAYEIELIGLGREAVLIVSKVALEFTECLIGNSYERKLGLKNVGDVNYPVTFKLEKEFSDLEFMPPSLVINPFSENHVIVSYTPTKETRSTVVMVISSPYSTHKVPVLLHAGTAVLEFSADELDFGMFERVTRPSLKLIVKNVGTVRTSFTVRDVAKPSMFQLTGSKGMLYPSKSAEVTITHIRHEVCQFSERLVVRSDLIDKFYYIKVKGQCEEALLKPEEFSLLNMGICPVLESTVRSLSFKNYGRFPLEFSVKSAYPLKVTTSSGIVPGGESGSISVTWNPSGGYELRTQITMVTNIGNYNVIVRGKAAFPELSVKNMYLDFGVCAVNHTYVEKFAIANKGRVPLHFNIPTLREPSYSVSLSQGQLDVKESVEIDVMFRPSGIGRFANSFIIECKGVSYKEIVVVGIGGQMRLDISPQLVDIGRSPCDLRVYHVLMLTNTGDVTLHVEWDQSPQSSTSPQQCLLTLPEPVIIPPGRIVRCIFGATALVVGELSSSFILRTKEKTYTIGVSGIGVRIKLTERSRRILESENLTSLSIPGPFARDLEIKPIDYWARKLGSKLMVDLAVVDSIQKLMEIAKSIKDSPSKTISPPESAFKNSKAGLSRDSENMGSSTSSSMDQSNATGPELGDSLGDEVEGSAASLVKAESNTIRAQTEEGEPSTKNITSLSNAELQDEISTIPPKEEVANGEVYETLERDERSPRSNVSGSSQQRTVLPSQASLNSDTFHRDHSSKPASTRAQTDVDPHAIPLPSSAMSSKSQSDNPQGIPSNLSARSPEVGTEDPHAIPLPPSAKSLDAYQEDPHTVPLPLSAKSLDAYTEDPHAIPLPPSAKSSEAYDEDPHRVPLPPSAMSSENYFEDPHKVPLPPSIAPSKAHSEADFLATSQSARMSVKGMGSTPTTEAAILPSDSIKPRSSDVKDKTPLRSEQGSGAVLQQESKPSSSVKLAGVDDAEDMAEEPLAHSPEQPQISRSDVDASQGGEMGISHDDVEVREVGESTVVERSKLATHSADNTADVGEQKESVDSYSVEQRSQDSDATKDTELRISSQDSKSAHANQQGTLANIEVDPSMVPLPLSVPSTRSHSEIEPPSLMTDEAKTVSPLLSQQAASSGISVSSRSSTSSTVLPPKSQSLVNSNVLREIEPTNVPLPPSLPSTRSQSEADIPPAEPLAGGDSRSASMQDRHVDVLESAPTGETTSSARSQRTSQTQLTASTGADVVDEEFAAVLNTSDGHSRKDVASVSDLSKTSQEKSMSQADSVAEQNQISRDALPEDRLSQSGTAASFEQHASSRNQTTSAATVSGSINMADGLSEEQDAPHSQSAFGGLSKPSTGSVQILVSEGELASDSLLELSQAQLTEQSETIAEHHKSEEAQLSEDVVDPELILLEISEIRKQEVIPISDVNAIADKFLNYKRTLQVIDSQDEFMSSDDDLVVRHVLDYGRLKIYDIELDVLTDMVQPGMEVPLSVVLERPPAICKEEKNKREFHLAKRLNPSEIQLDSFDFQLQKICPLSTKDTMVEVNGTALVKSVNATHADKDKKKRRRKKKKASAAPSRTVDGTTEDETANDSDDGLKFEVEYIAPPPPEIADPAFSEFERIFAKFSTSSSAENPVETEEAAEEPEDEEAEGEKEEEQDKEENSDDENDEVKALSKKKKRMEQRLSVAQLKQLVTKPEVVEWVDVTAADPKLLVHLKAYKNSVPVPIHWQQKRKYLQGKRGIEKPPFELPDFIKQTGIMELRNSIREKDDAKGLKSKTRDRVQPKMGKLDIDYQKLHDAFFRWQTKPKLTIHGEMYYEGKEFETKLKLKKPGQLSEELKNALNIPPLAPPPWLVNMQRYGPPPSYTGLKIAGLNAPIPEGAQWGYHPGGWGKPPVDEYGRPLYGDVFGVTTTDKPSEYMVEIERKTWGELEEEEGDEDREEEEEELAGRREEDDVPPEGLVTPSGLTSVPSGLETPDFIELRKDVRREDEGPRELYKVIPQKEVAIRGFMGSQHAYDMSAVSSSSDSSKKRKAVPGVIGNKSVDVAINPEDLEEGLEEDAVRRAYDNSVKAANKEMRGEDFSDMVAEHAQREAKKRKKDDKKDGKGKDRDKFKF